MVMDMNLQRKKQVWVGQVESYNEKGSNSFTWLISCLDEATIECFCSQLFTVKKKFKKRRGWMKEQYGWTQDYSGDSKGKPFKSIAWLSNS